MRVFLSLARPLLKAQVYAVVTLKIQRVWYALPQLHAQVHTEPAPAYLEIASRRLFMRGLSPAAPNALHGICTGINNALLQIVEAWCAAYKW